MNRTNDFLLLKQEIVPLEKMEKGMLKGGFSPIETSFSTNVAELENTNSNTNSVDNCTCSCSCSTIELPIKVEKPF